MMKMAVACATDASSITLDRVVSDALDAGASEDDVVGVLVVCGPMIGASRVVRTAPAVAEALDYDAHQPLESLEFLTSSRSGDDPRCGMALYRPKDAEGDAWQSPTDRNYRCAARRSAGSRPARSMVRSRTGT